MSIVSSVRKEEITQRSPRGKLIGGLLECIEHLEPFSITNTAVLLTSAMQDSLIVFDITLGASLPQASHIPYGITFIPC
jgi:hypothetical protein